MVQYKHIQKIKLLKYKNDGIDFLLEDFSTRIIPLEQYYAFHSWKNFNYDCLKDGVFDFDKKYQLKKFGNIYFVNLRFDDIKNWRKIIQSIDTPIDLSKFKIIRANSSENKWCKKLYKDFLAEFTLSQATFDVILLENADEMSHFYTGKEIQNFIKKWKPHIVY